LNTSASSPIELLSCQIMTFRKDSHPVYAYYMPTQLGKNEQIPYTADVCIYGTLKNPVLIDPYTGDVFEISKPIIPDDPYDSGIIEYKNLPLRDYPLILTEKKAFEIV